MEKEIGPEAAPADLTLVLEQSPGLVDGILDSELYLLEIIGAPRLDPFFSSQTFFLPLQTGASAGGTRPSAPAPSPGTDIEIDYRTRDYQGFRQLMLDRLAAVWPDWQQRHPEDATTVLVELLAHAADSLSYYQDAVATEAYLGTARRRLSLRRHAALMGRSIDEGCNARVWVQVQVSEEFEGAVKLPAGTQLVAGSPKLPDTMSTGRWQRLENRYPDAMIFETMHPARLYAAHNRIEIYDWSAREFRLTAGTTSAMLKGDLDYLKSGDVLIFEEAMSPGNGQIADRDPRRRQAVRVVRSRSISDPLNPEIQALYQVDWHPNDALTEPFIVSARDGMRTLRNVSVVYGNVVLADHGRTIVQQDVSVEAPASRSTGGQLRLGQRDLTFRAPYDHKQSASEPAALSVQQPAATVTPAVELVQDGMSWRPCDSLLDEDAYGSVFVVEMNSDREATLRFGDGIDGLCPRPSSEFRAHRPPIAFASRLTCLDARPRRGRT